MMRLVAVAMGVVWALAGWRNVPPLEHRASVAVGFVVATSLALAYLAGYQRQKDLNRAVAISAAEATAVASVTAQTTSSSSVNVFIASAESMAPSRAARAERFASLEGAPWMVGAHRAAEVEEDALAVALEDVQDEREAVAR